jgi:hypothetical protein
MHALNELNEHRYSNSPASFFPRNYRLDAYASSRSQIPEMQGMVLAIESRYAR